MLLMCNSTTGLRTSLTASSTGIRPNEKPAGLMISAASCRNASWIQSISSLSLLV
jgi:hypothetical protein